jgi:membrane protease YdiL (CAAX protease family)
MNASSVSSQSVPASKGLKETMRRHPLFSFFFLAYAISWVLFIPYVLAEWGYLEGNYNFFYILHVFGPALAAIVTTSVVDGKAGWQNMRQRIRQWRAHWTWYAFILLGIPALVMLGIVVQPGALNGFKGFTISLLAGYPFYLAAVFFGVGLGEEPGWRGFALPRMQTRYGSLWGTLILGVLWSCWHLPDFLTASKGGGQGASFNVFLMNFSIFTLAVVSLSVIMTWIFNHTGASIFIAILAHASVDAPEVAGWAALFPAVSMIGLHVAMLISFAVPALLILILTRGRLGYKPHGEMPLQPEQLEAQPIR